MERIWVRGGRSLSGTVRVSGAKNAALPIIAASLLTDKEVRLHGIPALEDICTMGELVEGLGAQVRNLSGGSLQITARSISEVLVPYEMSRRMRASILVMGPLLARRGSVRIAFPGGCAIGQRPIDLHLKGFEAMGARISNRHGLIEARLSRGYLRGAKVYLDFPSVGATENIMMAATLARGVTTIDNAAQEPEIVDLANFLLKLGAKISGAGTSSIRIEGTSYLDGGDYTILPDRIEAGTYMVAAVIAGGNVFIDNCLPEHCQSVIAKLRETGAIVEEENSGVRVVAPPRPRAVNIKTLPYPGFPTDMQAQMTALLCVSEGAGSVTETIFENRFLHIPELTRMGADIHIEGRTVLVRGVKSLTGTTVKAPDLRAGAALVLAGLAAVGTTEIVDVYHIDRGYEAIEEKLRGLGADIGREGIDEPRVATAG